MIYSMPYLKTETAQLTSWVTTYEKFHAIASQKPFLAIQISARKDTSIPWSKALSFYALIWTGNSESINSGQDRRYTILRAENAKSSARDGIYRSLMNSKLQMVRFVPQNEWLSIQKSICLPTPIFIDDIKGSAKL